MLKVNNLFKSIPDDDEEEEHDDDEDDNLVGGFNPFEKY